MVVFWNVLLPFGSLYSITSIQRSKYTFTKGTYYCIAGDKYQTTKQMDKILLFNAEPGKVWTGRRNKGFSLDWREPEWRDCCGAPPRPVDRVCLSAPSALELLMRFGFTNAAWMRAWNSEPTWGDPVPLRRSSSYLFSFNCLHHQHKAVPWQL